MGISLLRLTPQEFHDRLAASTAGVLDSRLAASLYAHYLELARWNPRLSLIGPGTAVELVERHYGESLAALPLLPPEPGRLLDLGSGAGFPGWVLAAARPDWRVTLVEPHGRKATFLRTAARRAGVAVQVVDARVGAALPEGLPTDLDRITVRALKLKPRELEPLAERLRAGGEVLFWAGRDDPPVPEGWRRVREQPLPGRTRRVLAYRPRA
ncbi:MAG: 16S rRNA (guanine(527)-N(7))-methyltransferase RsmG [Thermoanaerobaculia bacterium]